MSFGSAIVVGGGITGLTCAHDLARAGVAVTVVERASQSGGLAAGAAIGDATWDRFYHVILESDADTRTMLREVGLEEGIVWRTVRNAMHVDGATYPFSSAADFLALPALGPIDKLRFAATIAEAAYGGIREPLDRRPIIDHLRAWSGRRVTERIWRPLLRAKLGDGYEDASAAFIRATFRRLYRARPHGAGPERFGYVPGGYNRIVNALVGSLQRSGVVFRTGAAVREIRSLPDGVAVATDSGVLRADRAIVTLPSPACAKVVSGLLPEERDALAARRYIGVVCVSLLLDAPSSGYYLTNVADEAPFTGIVESTALIDRAEVGGRALVYLPKYAAATDPVFARSEGDLLAEFGAALARVRPHWSADRVVGARVNRAREVFAFPGLGDASRLPPLRLASGRVAVVNASRIRYSTLNVSDTIASARSAMAELARDPHWRTEEDETVGRHIA